MDRKIYDFPPGTVIVVGPKGRLVLGAADGHAEWKMVNCSYYLPDYTAPGIPELRDYAWRKFDDTGTKRLDGGDGIEIGKG